MRVSDQIASLSGRLADDVRTRPQMDAHYATLVRDCLQRSGSATRQEIDALLLPLLPEVLSTGQKEVEVSNLLAELRREGSIVNAGTRTQPRWELS
ncbi:hypothetical protein [Arachnia propionica]|uniref:Uncharacterized protein n=1 Tax=Arachnia propionica TaxID=1750 RepID=A0A3P1WQI1_9ACTN|nr:hypothetical protein [Arachnia propionica]RRD48879.1 hypothetical protein EII35_10635 [Arachnia propionica]